MEETAEQRQDTSLQSSNLTENAIKALNSSKGWMRFIAIFGFILCGLMALAGIGVLVGGSSNAFEGELAAYFNYFGYLYLLIAFFYFLPSYFLIKYAGGIDEYYINREPASLDRAFRMHKRYFTMMGILLIVGIVCGVLIGFFAVFLSLTN